MNRFMNMRCLLTRAMASVIMAWCLASQASAQQTLYWSGTTGTSSTGSLWTAVNAWSLLNGSWSPPAAVPGSTTDAVFSYAPITTPQIVYLGGDQAARSLTFSSPAATTLLGGASGAPAVSVLALGTSGITTSRGAGTATIGSVGDDTVSIVLAGSQAWSTASSTRLNVLGSVTGQAGTPTTLTFGGLGLSTLSGAIADGATGGTVSLVKSGYGSVRLAGASTYSGSTAISNGTLVISNGAALGSAASTVAVAGIVTRGTATGGMLLLDGLRSGITLSRTLSLQGMGGNGFVDSNGNPAGAALVNIGNNTLSGSVLLGSGSVATNVVSPFGTLSLTGTLAVGSGAISSFGQTNQAGAGIYDLSGVLVGSGTLNTLGSGATFLNASDSSGFDGQIRINAGNGIRITRNGVIGSRAGTGANAPLQFNANTLLETRMDAPLLQGSGTAAGINANLFLNISSGQTFTMLIDHAPGSTAASGTLALGNVQHGAAGGFNANGRNGYSSTFASLTVPAGSGTSSLSNGLGGLLTVTGSFWNMTDNAGARSYQVSGGGNTLIAGNILASAAAFDHSLIKAGAGLLTITSTGATLDGALSVQAGGVQITDFNSINNIASGTIALGATTTAGALVIGTSVSPGGTAALTSQRRIDLAGTTAGGSIFANQSGAAPVVFGSDITVSGSGAKTLVLAGTSSLDNAFNGAIINGTFAGTPATSLAKQGPGTWVLGGTNTYTGATTISNGTLKLQANAATSTNIADSSALTFNADTPGFAGGTLELVGQASVNNVETLGQLTPTQGANTIRLTPGAGGNASLVFASLGTLGKGATVNVVGSSATSMVTLTGAATGLAAPSLYVSGSNFAYSASGVLRAPVYGTDAGFVTASGSTTLPSGQSNFNVTGNITAQTSSTASTLRLAGSNTLTLGSGQTLTLRTGAAGTDGGILATSGSSTITGGNVTTGGAGALFVRVDGSSDQLTLASGLSTDLTGGLTKGGAGVLVLSGSNLQVTGNTTINEGTVRLSGASSRLSGANVTTIIRQGATLDLNGISTSTAIGSFTNNGTVTNSSATAATLQVGNGDTAGISYGVMQDGAGVLNVTKVGTGNQSWLGTSTYTGVTRIGSTGLVTVDVLTDIGQASGIGRGNSASTATNVASLVFDGSTGGIVYTGNLTGLTQGAFTFGSQQGATNRLFTLAGTGATISSSANNSNAIIWTNTNAIVFGTTAPQTITFAGSSSGDNTFRPLIQNNTLSGSATSLTKSGGGIWVLENAANSYTGPTVIAEGFLASGTAGGIPSASPIRLGNAATNGVLLASGVVTRSLAATAVNGANTITWSGSNNGGGFAAYAGKLVVAIGGTASPTPLTWGSGGFVGTSGSQALVLGAATGLAEVEFQNPINLAGGARTITVNDNANTGADFATLSGVISGSGGLVKAGGGQLALTGASTYSGTTSMTSGLLTVTSLGNSATPGVGSSVGGGTDANLAANALVGGGGSLQYVGPGETSDRMIRMASGLTINADGSGPLILTNLANDTGAKTLTLRGVNTDRNEIASNLADNGGALAITLNSGATWVLSGSNSFSGAVSVSYGALGIGNDFALGSGTFALGNTSLFAAGAARTVANNLTWADNTSLTFTGDYDLTFTGSVSHAITSNNLAVFNNAQPGTTLTLNRITANSLTSGAMVVSGQGNTTIGSISTSTSSLLPITKNGTGTLTLGTGTEASFFPNRGNLTINDGTVDVRVPVVRTSVSLVSGTISGTSTLDATSFGISNSSGTAVVSTSLIGTGGVTKSSAGLAILSGTNSYTGATAINAGILRGTDGVSIGTANVQLTSGVWESAGTITRVLGTGSNQVRLTSASGTSGFSSANAGGITVAIGGTAAPSALTWGDTNFTMNALTLNATTATGPLAFRNAIALGSSTNRTIIVGANTATITGALSGASSGLIKQGGGTLALAAANSFSGTVAIQEGLVAFGSVATGTTTNQPLGLGTAVTLGVAGTSAGELEYTTATSGTLDKNVSALGSGRNRIRNSGGGTLTLSGTLVKNGTILELAQGTFAVSGRVTGTNATSDLFVNGAAVTLSNTNNDYNGPTYVYGGGALSLGASNVLPNASALILGGTGSDTGTGTIATGTFTDTLASLTTSSLGGTVSITGSGATIGGVTTTGNVTFGAGTDTLALSLSGLTQPFYKLFTYQGTRSGTFDQVTGLTSAPNYMLTYGAASAGSIDLQMRATLGIVSASTANATVIVGGSTAVTYTVANTSPAGAATLAFTSANGTNIVGASSGTAAADQTSPAISGLVFSGAAVGIGQTGSFTVTDLDAITQTGTGTVTVDVLNHSLASFQATDAALLSIGLGTYDVSSQTWTSGSGTAGFSVWNIASGGFSNAETAGLSLYDVVFTSGNDIFNTGLSNFPNLTAGTSNAYIGSVTSPGLLAEGTYSGVYTLKFRDQQNLSGATPTRDLALTMNVVVVPEPGAIALAGIGAAVAGWVLRTRRGGARAPRDNS